MNIVSRLSGKDRFRRATRRMVSGGRFMKTAPAVLMIALFYSVTLILGIEPSVASYLGLGLLLTMGAAFGLSTASVWVLAALTGGEAARYFGGYASLTEVIPTLAALVLAAAALPFVAAAEVARAKRQQRLWSRDVTDVRVRVGQRVGELSMATPLPPEMEPATSPEALAQSLMPLIKRMLKCRTVVFYWYHDKSESLVPICSLSDLESSLNPATIPIAKTRLAMALRAPGMFPVHVSESEPRSLPLYVNGVTPERVAVVPVRFQDKLAGVFVLERTTESPWAADADVANQVGRLVSDALVTEQRLRSSLRLARHFQQAIEAVHELSHSKGFQSVYETMVRYATRLSPFSHCVMAHRTDIGGQEFEICGVSSADLIALMSKRFTLQGNLCAVAANASGPVPERYVFRSGMAQPFGQGLNFYLDPGDSCLVLPMRAQGSIFGFLLLVDGKMNRDVRARGITSDELVPVTLFADYCAQALANAESNRTLERLAVSDPVTGLPNQRALLGRMHEATERAKRTGRPMSLLFCDMDHVKSVNDRYGHQAGDLVLKRLADVMRTNLRAVDYAGRYGGEEFMAILEDAGPDGAMKLAERIRASVEALRFPEYPRLKGVTVSIGIATYGVDSTDSDHLIALADSAMYAAKHAGRNQCHHVATSLVGEVPELLS